MKAVAVALAAVLLAGCAADPATLAAANNTRLEKILAPQFVVATVPAQYRSDFYAVLAVFAKERRADEFVRRAEFALTGEITLYFSDNGMHGGGLSIFRRRDEQWVENKSYFM